MPKQTVLSDNAEIYQLRNDQTEKEKLRDMPFKKKIEYLWNYYRWKAFFVIAGIALITYLAIDIFTPDINTELYAAVIDNTIEDSILQNLQKNFADYLHLNPKRNNVVINSSFYLSGDNEYSMNMKQVLTTYVSAQQVDVIIAPKSVFSSYTYNGFMSPLSDQLPTDLYSSLTDQFYISATDEKSEEAVYGINLSDTDLIKKNTSNNKDDPYILGIVANSKHKESAVDFIRYLFGSNSLQNKSN